MTSKHKYKRHDVPAIKHNRRKTDRLKQMPLATQTDLLETKKAFDRELLRIQKKLDVIINKLKENEPLYI